MFADGDDSPSSSNQDLSGHSSTSRSRKENRDVLVLKPRLRPVEVEHYLWYLRHGISSTLATNRYLTSN